MNGFVSEAKQRYNMGILQIAVCKVIVDKSPPTKLQNMSVPCNTMKDCVGPSEVDADSVNIGKMNRPFALSIILVSEI
jgi:hypothetical protein